MIDLVIVNLTFLAILDSFVSFFRDEVFSNIDTSELAGRNVRDILKSYFEENPISQPDPGGSGSTMGFSSKYDFSKSLTFLPAKSAVLMLEKTSSLKKETKLSNSAKNIRFTITRSIIA